ncbi:MAG: cell division protein FtsL [Pseudomonadales bacterium]|nr:cell division protein FtsL [Pseudomonadales bacterium]
MTKKAKGNVPKFRGKVGRSVIDQQNADIKVRSDRNFLLLTGALYLGIAVTGLYVSAGSQEMRGLFQQLTDIQLQQDNLLAEHSRLLLERSTHSTYQNIDQIAEVQLDMKFPESIQRVSH